MFLSVYINVIGVVSRWLRITDVNSDVMTGKCMRHSEFIVNDEAPRSGDSNMAAHTRT